MLFPLWVWTAFAGLGVGMLYAFVGSRKGKPEPRPLDDAAVDEITALVAAGKSVRAVKLLRRHTGTTLLDAKNRVDDWRPDEEREGVL